MNPEQFAEGFSKGLEAWTLQNIVDGGMVLIFLALGMIISRAYLLSYKQRMNLRLSVEIWEVAVDISTDLFLLVPFLIGLLTTNPDIMVDIKIALPWFPLAFLFSGVALILRLFHGGSKLLSASWWGALFFTASAAVASWFGFTFVMEAATDEYFEHAVYPVWWQALYNMRSDINRDLGLTTFYWMTPLFFMVILWAVVVGIKRTKLIEK